LLATSFLFTLGSDVRDMTRFINPYAVETFCSIR
jgi:hypothetical protein